MNLLKHLPLLLTVVLVGCSGGADAPADKKTSPGAANGGKAKAPSPAGSAALQGRVTLSGAPVPPRFIQVTKNPESCGAAEGDFQELVLSSDQGIVGAVVEIQGVDEPAGGWPATPPLEIHQKGCMFSPHIAVMRSGGEVAIHNDDPVAHNVNTPEWNVVQGPGEPAIVRTIDARLPFKINCNVHTWMECWVYPARSSLVTVTDASGAYHFDTVPPGEYRLIVWHPALTRKRLPVAIGAEPQALDVEFESPVR